jgi:hypothetical protein
VVIPARDEADSIGPTLRALAGQQGFHGRPLDPESYEVIVLANNCRDETAAIARRLGAGRASLALHVAEVDLPLGEAHVGLARRIAMDEACRRLLAVGRPGGVIATTDADTLVAPTWLAATLREVELGAEAVGGRIMVAARERQALPAPVRSRFLRNVGYHALVSEVAARLDPRPGDPWPCHGQFFGASLAITARAYCMVGGLPVLASSEDKALDLALRRLDIEIRHSVDVRVYTSGRLTGRAPAGLAALLSTWSSQEQDDRFQLVPSAATVVARARCRRSLRDLWARLQASREPGASEVARLAELAGLPEAWLRQALLEADRFGLLLDAFESRVGWHQQPGLVDVRQTLDELRAWLEPYRRQRPVTPILARPDQGPPGIAPTRPAEPLLAPSRSRPSLAALEQVEPVGPLAPSPQVA